MADVALRVVEHGPAVELQLEVRPERRDRVAAWYSGGVLVDAGGALTAPELLEWLRGRPVEGVYLGHWHEDHTGGAAALAAAGLPLFAGAATARRLRRPPPIPDYRAELWGQIEPVPVAAVPGGGPLRALPMPGHSPDQLGYFDRRSGVLFSGDVALRRNQVVAMSGEDPWASMASIRAILSLGPAALATSHRSLLREWRPYLEEQLGYLEDVAARIIAARDKGLSAAEIVTVVFGGEARLPDRDIAWKEWSGGEFSTARWVRAFLSGRAAAASSRS